MRERMASSGRQFEITDGDARAVVYEVGATLAGFESGGLARTETYPPTVRPPKGAGAVLAPWPNRVRGGRWRHDGVEQQLALTEPAAGNAIHGLLRHVPWSVEDHRSDRLTLSAVATVQPGWPQPVRVQVTWSVSSPESRSTGTSPGAGARAADAGPRSTGAPDGADAGPAGASPGSDAGSTGARVDAGSAGASPGAGLTVSTTATCLGDGPVPFGLGFHPYLRVGDTVTDDLLLTLGAGTELPLTDQLPSGVERRLADTDPLRVGSSLRGLELDSAFGGCVPAAGDGYVRHRVTDRDGRGTELWADPAFGWVQVYTPSDFPGRGRAVAVEPMTCPPDALNSGIDLVTLEPGHSWTATWGIRPYS